MTCKIGFGAYRTEAFPGHRIPVRFILPNGKPHKDLSRACSWIWRCQKTEVKAKRWVSTFVDALNTVHNAAANDNFDVAEHFVRGVRECREIQDMFFKALDVPSATAPDRSLWLKPEASLWGKVADTLIAFGMVTKALRLAAVFKGQDPSKVNKRSSRIGGKVAEFKVTRRGLRLDVDNRLRLNANPTAAPRYDDPRVSDRLRAGLLATGSQQVFGLMVDMAVSGGGRAMNIFGQDLYDVFVRGKGDGHYPSRNKGDGAAERNFVAKPQQRVHDANMAWVAGRRMELTGQSLEEIQRIALDPLRRDELKGQPFYTEDGKSFIKYNRLYRVVRRAAERMDLFIDDEECRTSGIKRWVTMHLLRHEYVHRRLDYVDTLPTEEAKNEERKAIIAYMKWTFSADGRCAMLDWYSRHHVAKKAEASAHAHNVRQDKAMEGAALVPKGDAANDADMDTILRALN